MNEDILDAIKKNLPAMAAGELSKYIEEMEELKEDYESIKVQYQRLEVSDKEKAGFIEELKKTNAELKIVNDSWMVRSAAIEEREKKADINDLNQRINAEYRVNTNYSQIMNLLFANTVIRETFQKSIAVDGGGNTGNGGYMNGGRVEKVEETKTTEKA